MTSKPTVQRGIGWVLRTAAIVAVLGTWLGVLGSVAIDVRTGCKLAGIVSEAQQFATLPRVTPQEVAAFVARRLQRDGLARDVACAQQKVLQANRCDGLMLLHHEP